MFTRNNMFTPGSQCPVISHYLAWQRHFNRKSDPRLSDEQILMIVLSYQNIRLQVLQCSDWWLVIAQHFSFSLFPWDCETRHQNITMLDCCSALVCSIYISYIQTRSADLSNQRSNLYHPFNLDHISPHDNQCWKCSISPATSDTRLVCLEFYFEL